MIIHTNQIEGTKYDTNAVMLKNYILFLILRQKIIKSRESLWYCSSMQFEFSRPFIYYLSL